MSEVLDWIGNRISGRAHFQRRFEELWAVYNALSLADKKRVDDSIAQARQETEAHTRFRPCSACAATRRGDPRCTKCAQFWDAVLARQREIAVKMLEDYRAGKVDVFEADAARARP